MCLSIPAKIESINGDKARVSVSGNSYEANISLINNPEEGDYILLHAGFAIQKISTQHARETLELLEEMKQISKD